MSEFFIGFAVGIYVLGVLIVAFMKGMGGDHRAPSALLWPITYFKGFWKRG